MSTAQLVDEFRRQGIELSLSGDELKYRATKGTVTPAVLQVLKKRKQEILRELRADRNLVDSNFEQLTRTIVNDEHAQVSDHPFCRYVEPLKSRLLGRVGLDVEFVKGEGCHLWDEAGHKYLDCIAQYGALPFGYNPSDIWDAIQRVREQRIPNVATQSVLGSAGELADRLLKLLPIEFEHVIFCNSGAESVEVAIKMCRAASGRRGILSTKNAFHGLTNGALAVCGSDSFKDGFFVESDDCHQVTFGSIVELRDMFSRNPDYFAAFIVEPIQGEAGIVLPPNSYLASVRQLCDEFGVLMVVDEIQTGLGRTGSLFAFEVSEIVPDVICVAKALGGGLVSCGAVISTSAAYSIRFGLRHSSTFAGNSLASECGMATLDILQKDNSRILKNIRDRGDYLLSGLRSIQERFPELVVDVRGRGFMAAIEFDFDYLNDRKGLLPILVDEGLLLHLMVAVMLRHHKVRLAPSFMGREVIRIEPPLTFDIENCDRLLTALKHTIELVEDGNTAALVSTMFELEEDKRTSLCERQEPGIQKMASSSVVSETPTTGEKTVSGEFGFLVHLSGISDLVDFDDSLAQFSEDELKCLKRELTRSSEPMLVGKSDFCSSMGTCVRGHFILVPFTPEELVQMEHGKALRHIENAAKLAAEQNVDLIGLGGFTSVISYGGFALRDKGLPAITSGNGLTTAATVEAIRTACVDRGVQIFDSVVAVVGASGQIGQALALMLSENAAKTILVGRDGSDRTIRRLSALAEDILLRYPQRGAESVSVASDISEIESANIVAMASSAVEPFVQSGHVCQNAIVCDASRPPNVSASVISSRPDVRWIEGGVISIPGASNFDLFAGPETDGAYACVAETALWALEPELGKPDATRMLDLDRIHDLWNVAQKHGFKVKN